MNEIAKQIGRRLRTYRLAAGYTQETLAELADCHPTYIGQLERGEKNATVESVARIAAALRIPLSRLFEKLGETEKKSLPLLCYDLISQRCEEEQKKLYDILLTAVSLCE